MQCWFVQAVDLEEYAWIHLEGRNRENVLQILAYLASQRTARLADERPAFRVSVEVEKVNRNFEDFIPHADVVFISKVNYRKYCMQETVFCAFYHDASKGRP